MCPIQFREDGPPHGPLAFMQWDTFTRIVDEFETLRHLHLQGLGEPMMHPRFFDMVRYATDRDIKVTTNTNLTLINDRRAEACVTSGLRILHGSIDAASADLYERIRVKANHGRVVSNLERLLKTREQMGREYPHVHLTMVIMQKNLHELPELVEQAIDWSVEEMFVQHLCHDFGESTLPDEYRPMRDFVQAETLAEEEPTRIARYFDEARELAEDAGLALRLPRTRPKRYASDTPGRERCSWPWTAAYFSYEGYAMPCCMVSTPDRINFGNISEHRIREIWNSDAYENFRERLNEGPPPEVCSSCSLYWGTF